MRILYFFEDRAQERFIRALVNRVAEEESLPASSLTHDVRSAQHGSRVVSEFGRFARDTMEAPPPDVDLLVVAVDGNCKGYADRRGQLQIHVAASHPLTDRIVYAVPDPHIERWYLLDQGAFRDGVGVQRAPDLPPYKCARHYYKRLLAKALSDSAVGSLLGGAEYAERIVDSMMTLDTLAHQDTSFRRFIDDLRAVFRRSR